MNLYYTSGKCASYIRNDPFFSPTRMSELVVPRELVTHELLGMHLINNPPWSIKILEEGDKAPHRCFMILNSSEEVDKYK